MGNPVRDEDARVTDSGEKGLSFSRSAQLRRDMELTPEDRVRAAEETLKLDRLRAGIIVHRVIGFERYEDYLDYKWKSRTGGA